MEFFILKAKIYLMKQKSWESTTAFRNHGKQIFLELETKLQQMWTGINVLEDSFFEKLKQSQISCSYCHKIFLWLPPPHHGGAEQRI